MSKFSQMGAFCACVLLAGASWGLNLPPALLTQIEAHLPMSFYATPSKTHATKIYPLVSQTKRVNTKGMSVNVAEDQLVLLEFSPDKKVVNVAYPVGSNGDYLTGWFRIEDVLDLNQLKLKPPTEYVASSNAVRHFLYQAKAQGKPCLVGCARDMDGAIKLGERRVKAGPRSRSEEVYHLLCLTKGSASVGEYQLAGRLVLAREVPALKEEDYLARVAQMIDEYSYRVGRHWDNSTHPIVIRNGNGGCAAFATDFAGYVFDAHNFNSGERYDSASEIRSGDVIRLQGHYITVLERHADGSLLTMDGNCNKSIRRSTRAYSIVNGELKGGKFVNGWHYLSKELPSAEAGKKSKKKNR